MVEKMKTDVDRQLLVWKMQKSTILEKSIGNIFFIIKIKSRLSSSVFIITSIHQIFEIKFMHYVRKHLKIGSAFSHELATFLKYHMPLIFLALA